MGVVKRRTAETGKQRTWRLAVGGNGKIRYHKGDDTQMVSERMTTMARLRFVSNCAEMNDTCDASDASKTTE